jgi:AraC-like DNA-binding protein
VSLLLHRPAPPLDRYVHCIWWSVRDTPDTTCEHILPSGSAQLVFALHDEPIGYRPSGSSQSTYWSGSLIHGPQWGFYVAGPKSPGVVAGVSFRAGCASAILGVGASEVLGQHLALGTLWGSHAESLRGQLFEAREPVAAFRILERHLIARIHRPLLMHPAVAHALAAAGPGWDVRRHTGYSPKHFISLFKASVGLTPTHFYRIRRFKQVARSLASADTVELADLASQFGYSDQAHLTREFREFAGVPPTQYQGRSESPLHHRPRTSDPR